MGIPFIALIDKTPNGPTLVFQTGTRGVYYHQRVELSPGEAWNLLADYKARNGFLAFSYCLPLTQSQVEEATRFDPENPLKDRAAHIRELTSKNNAINDHDKFVPMLEEAQLGQLQLYKTHKFFGQLDLQDTWGPILGIEEAELQKGYQAYLDWRQNQNKAGPGPT